MREAEDIASEYQIPVWAVRKIQAEAIRWATNMSGPLRGQIALAKADELDPPLPGHGSPLWEHLPP